MQSFFQQEKQLKCTITYQSAKQERTKEVVFLTRKTRAKNPTLPNQNVGFQVQGLNFLFVLVCTSIFGE